MRSSSPLLTALLLAPLAALHAAEPLRYNRDIRPILSENCFACHGPDKANQKAGLRLDVRDAAIQPAKSGDIAIVPGDAEKSTLIARIFTEDSDEIMPPPKSHKNLSAAHKGMLKRWIAEGAAYEAHWSFVPPVKPQAGSSIDEFIRAELPRHGLKPSPRADAATLVRRVALDLTGLPPTIEEQRRFTAPESYADMVEYFLSKPAFGEHMAVAWLDAARYADTNGYQVDRDRELWAWRDWVVRALNANMPFDRFTVEQLAGDLLPNPTLDQKIATGFHRNHMLNEEGGIIAEEFLAEYVADRVETTATVWMGQTFNCCRCHDHKYDPFTQQDFYAMKAFFHNVPERGVGLYSNPVRTNAPPFVRLPAPELEAKIAALNARLKPVEERLKASASGDLEPWAREIAAAAVDWQPLKPTEASGGDQPPKLEGEVVTIGPQESRSNDIRITAKLPPGKLTALRIECATTDAEARFQWSELKAGKAKLRPVEAVHAKALDGDRRTLSPISVAPGRPAQALFELETPLEGPEIVVTIGVENAGGTTRWRIFVTDADRELIAPESIVALAKIGPAKRTAPQRKQLADYRLSQLPEHRRLSDEAAALRKQLAAAEAEIPTTLVMEEMKEARPTFVLMRGAYDKPGEKVTAATPAVLPALASDLPRDRLGLAKWLVSPQNPLTARVTVNRLWQQVFGTGLVKTSEDFGAQGAPPSHPELLDWLAGEFIRSGWDVKHLMKLMVTSATYRQQSQLTPLLRERDPENRLLARGPRFRLAAEAVRDQSLAASGLLVGKIGGPSVKPYHPPGLYEQVIAQRDNPSATYRQGSGEDLHRRSLYTYWKRSVPNPGMMLFDAPFRETCTLRRTRSNTPLQALNLMNDPTYVEASRFLAQRMMREGGDAVDSRLTHGFRLLLARRPKAAELSILRAAYERTHADFEKDAAAAKALLAVGEAKSEATPNPAELAAFTSVASTLLNLDEVITRE